MSHASDLLNSEISHLDSTRVLLIRASQRAQEQAAWHASEARRLRDLAEGHRCTITELRHGVELLGEAT